MEVLHRILLELELYRLRTASDPAPGCPDFIIRYCETIVAREAGYSCRVDWSHIEDTARQMIALKEWMTRAADALKAAGYTVSEGGSWIDYERNSAYISSVESYGPATYGHPRAEGSLINNVSTLRIPPKE